MDDSTLRAAYARSIARRKPGEDCPSPDELMALAEGDLPESERLRMMRHVAACVACREDLAVLSAAVNAARRVEPPRRLWLAAAASLVFLAGGGLVVWQAYAGGARDVLRGGGADVRLVAPATDATVASPPLLVWRPVGAAAVYSVEIFAATGGAKVAGVSELSDTTYAVPATLPPGSYRWWVRSLSPRGEGLRSELRAFRLTSP
jgi:anti-sigma factor RsiW